MIDINRLNRAAESLIISQAYERALYLYLFLCDDDPTFEGGYYAERIGYCYEMAGRLQEAKFWYKRAVLANPDVKAFVDANKRVVEIDIDLIVPDQTG